MPVLFYKNNCLEFLNFWQEFAAANTNQKVFSLSGIQ